MGDMVAARIDEAVLCLRASKRMAGTRGELAAGKVLDAAVKNCGSSGRRCERGAIYGDRAMAFERRGPKQKKTPQNHQPKNPTPHPPHPTPPTQKTPPHTPPNPPNPPTTKKNPKKNPPHKKKKNKTNKPTPKPSPRPPPPPPPPPPPHPPPKPPSTQPKKSPGSKIMWSAPASGHHYSWMNSRSAHDAQVETTNPSPLYHSNAEGLARNRLVEEKE